MKFEKEYYEQSSLWEQGLLDYQIEVIEEIKRIIPEDVKTVLDAGCGNGVVSNGLAGKYDITALDISETALRYVKASKKFIGSIDKLPFESNSFDLVMVNDVLEHLDDETFGKALTEIERVSKKYIIVTSPFLENLKFNFTKCKNCKREYHINLHKRSFAFNQIRNIFKDFSLKSLTFCGRLYQSTHSAFTEERHRIEQFVGDPKAVCPFCGSKGGFETESDKSVQSRILDAEEFIFLQKNRDLWERRPDRQEYVSLYEKGYKSSEDSEVSPDLSYAGISKTNEILFSRALRVEELKPFNPYPQYQVLCSNYEYEHNFLRFKSETISDILKFSFPHLIKDSVLLNIELIANKESVITVSIYDSLFDRFRSLKELNILSGESMINLEVIDSSLPSRYGTLFQISLRGDISLRKIRLNGVGSVYEVEILKTDGYIKRRYKGIDLSLKTDQEDIKPLWFFDDLENLADGILVKDFSEKEFYKLNQKTLHFIIPCIENLREELTELSKSLSELENRREKCEEAYQQSLREIKALNDMLLIKESERRDAAALADKYFKDLKSLEERYTELNDKLNATEESRQKAEELYQVALKDINVLKGLVERKEEERVSVEKMYQESLAENQRLIKLVEQKEIQRVKAEEVAGKYLEDLKVMDRRYSELNDKLNQTEEFRQKAEKAYQEALAEIKSLHNLLEQKEEQRKKAEEVAGKYLEDLRVLNTRYQEINNRLNETEKLRAKTENIYQELLKEYNIFKVNYDESLKSADELKSRINVLEDKLGNLNSEFERVNSENNLLIKEREEYKSSYEILKGRKVRRLLVLSHMFPHRDQMVFGPFVLDQVKALLRYTDLDVRVISCRPFWMNTYNPLKLKEANRIYWEEMKKVRWEEWDGVKVMYPPYRVGGPFRFITHWHTYSQAVMSVINDVLRDFRFDMVHAHTAYIDGNAAKLIYERFRIPYIITEHMAPYSEYVRNPIVLSKSIESSRNALRILCVSPKFRDEIASFMPSDVRQKLLAYGNGVYTDMFYPVSEKNGLRTPIKLSFVGSLDERKNPLLMLKVFKRLRSAGLNVVLNILGKGPYLDKMKHFVADNNLADYVFFSHSLPSEEYAKFFREKTDILVHPSKSEGFGVVIIEALSCGKPVVTTRCGGPEYIIDDERLGRLVDVDDDDELYEAIVDVIENYESFDPVWMHNNIKERFGFENFAKRLREMYEEALKDL